MARGPMIAKTRDKERGKLPDLDTLERLSYPRPTQMRLFADPEETREERVDRLVKRATDQTRTKHREKPKTAIGQRKPAARATPKAAGRASWIGEIKLSKFSVPVKAFAAVAPPPDWPLVQICGKCKKKPKFSKTCEKHGDLAAEEIAMGYPYGKKYIALSREELDTLAPPNAGELLISRAIDAANFTPTLLAGRSLNLEPESDAAAPAYVTLWDAITRSGLWCTGKIVLGKKCWAVVLFATAAGLHVATLWDAVLLRTTSPRPRTLSHEPLAVSLSAAIKKLPRGLAKEPADQWQGRLNALVAARLKQRGAE